MNHFAASRAFTVAELLSVIVIGIILYFVLPWSWFVGVASVVAIFVLSLIAMALTPKPEPAIQNSQTSIPTRPMDRQLLEELVILNRKQHYWIRAIGIIYVLIPVVSGLIWAAVFLLRGAAPSN